MINKEQLDLLYKLKKEVEKSRNEALLHTINQVIKKVYLQQYTCSFVGHFSAGKSTLINLLIEQDILPSSPVPTTSNISCQFQTITILLLICRIKRMPNYLIMMK
ncbi:GTPases (dynamin-related) [Staphylococcus aureus]|nr:GTPases (dynamin-related) [Staphylococcus aureus]